jgi:hypothetical protein
LHELRARFTYMTVPELYPFFFHVSASILPLQVMQMRKLLLVGLVGILALSAGVSARNDVFVIYGQRGNALVTSGGLKSATLKPSYAFLRETPSVDCSALQAWLGEAYVETNLYAGFAEPAARDGDVWPSLPSTHWGIRVDPAAGGSFGAFVYDKFAAYARASLAAPDVSCGNLAAASSILRLVSGLSEDDRLLLCTRLDELFAAGKWDDRAAAFVLDVAALIPSTAIRDALQERAQILAPAAGTLAAADLPELARLYRLLGDGSGITADAIWLAALSLAGRDGGFRTVAGAIDSDLISTLYVAQTLALIGRAADLDAVSLRTYVLGCWTSPGFAPVGGLATGIRESTLHATYAATEILATLRNVSVP